MFSADAMRLFESYRCSPLIFAKLVKSYAFEF